MYICISIYINYKLYVYIYIYIYNVMVLRHSSTVLNIPNLFHLVPVPVRRCNHILAL